MYASTMADSLEEGSALWSAGRTSGVHLVASEEHVGAESRKQDDVRNEGAPEINIAAELCPLLHDQPVEEGVVGKHVDLVIDNNLRRKKHCQQGLSQHEQQGSATRINLAVKHTSIADCHFFCLCRGKSPIRNESSCSSDKRDICTCP